MEKELFNDLIKSLDAVIAYQNGDTSRCIDITNGIPLDDEYESDNNTNDDDDVEFIDIEVMDLMDLLNESHENDDIELERVIKLLPKDDKKKVKAFVDELLKASGQ